MMYYEIIYQVLDTLGRQDVPASCVEAWMRVQHGTLDGLSRARFALEVEIATICHDEDPAKSLRLAQSYGLPT